VTLSAVVLTSAVTPGAARRGGGWRGGDGGGPESRLGSVAAWLSARQQRMAATDMPPPLIMVPSDTGLATPFMVRSDMGGDTATVIVSASVPRPIADTAHIGHCFASFQARFAGRRAAQHDRDAWAAFQPHRRHRICAGVSIRPRSQAGPR